MPTVGAAAAVARAACAFLATMSSRMGLSLSGPYTRPSLARMEATEVPALRRASKTLRMFASEVPAPG